MKKYNKNLVIFAIFTFVTVIIFGPSIFFGFFSDDYHFLYITSLQTSVWKYFLTNNVGELTGGSYGPVLNLIFTLQYKIFHLQSWGYHLVILFAYTFTAFFIHKLVYALTNKKILGFLSGFLFLVLPNHVEVVSWVAVQPHVFATLFFVIGIYTYLCFIEKQKKYYYVISLFCLSLSIFTKETAIMFPVVLLLIELFFGSDLWLWEKTKQIIVRLAPFGILGILFLYLRFRVVGYLFGYYANQDVGFGIFQKIKMFVEINVSMFISSPYRQMITHWLSDNKIILFFIIVFLLGSLYLIKKQYRKILWFLGLSYFFMSVPFLSLQFNPTNDGGERYAYLLSIFAIIFVVVWLYGILHGKKKEKLIFFLCIGILVLISLSQIRSKLKYWDWSSQVRDLSFSQIQDFGDSNLETEQYYIFLGLPDNLEGAELMRNAIKEALYFETNLGYVSGERIPLYTRLTGLNDGTSTVKIEKREEGVYNLFVDSGYNSRIFTGFPKFEHDLASFKLENFILRDHSGDEIAVMFNKEKIEQFQQLGFSVILAFFDGQNMQFMPLNQ